MKVSILDKPAMRVLMIAVGILMMAASYNFFFIPNRIAPGGFSGLGTILYHLFGFRVGIVTLVMNIPLFLFAWRDQGTAYTLRSLIATIVLSAALDFLPIYSITDDILLAIVYGGALLGIGLGLVVRADSSTGGTDMLAKLLSDRFAHLSFGMTLFIVETVIVGFSGFIFGPQSALYAVLVLLMSSKLIDILQEGVNAAKAFYIITTQGNALSAKILRELHRGVTKLSGTGMYSGESRDILLCIIRRMEMTTLKTLVHETDPAAFMIVSDVREALGQGFSVLKQSKTKKPPEAEKKRKGKPSIP